jgi:propanol-preferring alcohol dehydrogenase
MQAWQYMGDRNPIALNEVPMPVAGHGEIVVEIKASGICHSDIGHLDGVISYMLKTSGGPRTLGHEIAGVVHQLGEGVSELALGDRVVIKASLESPGTERDGGFAPYVSVQRSIVLPVPDGVPWDQAAVATDGGMTSYHAVVSRAGARRGLKLGIIGFGGLGSLGMQAALGLGAEVYVAEVKEALFPAIREAGAADVAISIGAFAEVGLDAIVDFAGFGSTTTQACKTVRFGGRVVQVGLAAPEAVIDTGDFVSREIELLGSMGGTLSDTREVLRLMSERKLHASTWPIGFAEVPDAIQQLRDGTNPARAVILFE